MNRVAWAYAMEGESAWPQSADGRHVKSGHGEDMYGVAVEDFTSDHDDALDDISRLDACAQASAWRKKIDTAMKRYQQHALRMMYARDELTIETACYVVAERLQAVTGVDIYTCFDECLHEASVLPVEHHNAKARDELLDILMFAVSKAHRVVDS